MKWGGCEGRGAGGVTEEEKILTKNLYTVRERRKKIRQDVINNSNLQGLRKHQQKPYTIRVPLV